MAPLDLFPQFVQRIAYLLPFRWMIYFPLELALGRLTLENLGPGSIPTPTQPATAPAQRIEITDQLSTLLDWNTFEFSEFGFGDTVISVQATNYGFTAVPVTQNGHDFVK